MELFKSCILTLLLLMIIPLVSAKNSCSTNIDSVHAIQGSSENIPAKSEVWTKVSLPDNWRDRWPEYTGGVWYNIHWQLTCPDSNFSQESLALTINRITMAGKAYINHDLIWQNNSLVEPISRNWNQPTYWSIPPSSIQIGNNDFYLYVTGYPASSPGLGIASLGNSKDILKVYEDNIWSQRTIFIINICLSLTLGAICSCIWLFRRKEQAFGWFGLSTIFWSGFIYNILATETVPFPDSYIFMRVNIVFFLGYIYCFCLFTWRFLNRSYPRVERAFLIINVVFLITISLIPSDLLTLIIAIAFYANFLIFILNLFVVFYISFKTRLLETWLLSFAILGCLILSGIDLLSLLNILTINISILPYSSTFIAVFLTLTLSLHLTRSLKKIEQFNDELNKKIIQTSNDLTQSLQQQYSLALENNQLQTRLKLSYELHDGLGSTLTQAITSVNYHKKGNLDKAEVLAMLKTLNNDLRQIVDLFKGGQHPLPENPILWLAPLRHRFNTLLNELSIETIWQIAPEWRDPPNWQICSILYRILEEALSNIIKHSHANLVEVSFQYDGNVMILKIQDNGVGFDVESIFASGVSIGLQSIKSRVGQLNGQLTIKSKPELTTFIIIIKNPQTGSVEHS